MEPEIRYATTTDGVNIAYWIVGNGLPLVDVHSFGFSNVQLDWQADPGNFHHGLADGHRLIRFDHRGSGLSDRAVQDLSQDQLVADLEAVADHASIDQFSIFAEAAGSHVAIDYTVAHPERVSALVLHDGYARAEDFWNIPRVRSLLQLIDDWEMYSENLASAVFGWNAGSAARDFAAYIRASTTPQAMRLYVEQSRGTDLTDKLAMISVPTLLIQERESVFPPFEMARTLAARIQGSRLRVIESGTLWSPEVGEAILAAVKDFVHEACGSGEAPAAATAPLAGVRTVLFTDLVGHTEMMRRLGDTRGRELLRQHERMTRDAIKQHGGVEIKTDGDSFMVSFSSVASAVHCAVALQRAFAERNAAELEPLHVRMGLNSGEPIEDAGDLFGEAVILAARIASQAGPGEILIPETVRHLLAGKGFMFADRGDFIPKGFEDAVRLYEVRWLPAGSPPETE